MLFDRYGRNPRFVGSAQFGHQLPVVLLDEPAVPASSSFPVPSSLRTVRRTGKLCWWIASQLFFPTQIDGTTFARQHFTIQSDSLHSTIKINILDQLIDPFQIGIWRSTVNHSTYSMYIYLAVFFSIPTDMCPSMMFYHTATTAVIIKTIPAIYFSCQNIKKNLFYLLYCSYKYVQNVWDFEWETKVLSWRDVVYVFAWLSETPKTIDGKQESNWFIDSRMWMNISVREILYRFNNTHHNY